MKTKISRISRRTVAMVLSVLMLVSVLGLGSLITASAWTFNTTYLHISFDNGTNWTDYKIGDSAGSFTLNSSKTCKWVFCCEGTWYSDKGDSKPYSSGTFNNTSSGNYYYAKTGGSDYSATLPAGNYTFNFTNRYDNNATLQYVFYYSELTYPVTVVNGNGTSTINVGSSGQSVTAAAKGGYTFTNWTATGSCTVNNSSSSNSSTVTVRATGTGGTVTANYTEATAPADVVAGTDIMFYIQGYDGFNKLGNSSKALGGTSTRVGETNVSYVQIAKSSAGSYQYITNNPGNWQGVRNSNIGNSSAGKKHVAAGSTSTTNATTATTTLSSSSISSGTASITLNTTCGATTSSSGATLYYQYYLDGTLVSGSTTKAKTTSQSFALDTSSLSTASHTLKTIATDGYIFYIADTDTITVTNPKYDVTIGTVNNGSITSDKATAESGKTVTLTLSPSTGYNPVAPTITKAGGGTVTPTKVSNTSYTFTMPSQAVTVTATFTQKTYAITFSETGGSGTMKIDGTARASGYAVTHGSHTFRVDAPTGYHISSISGIGTWTNNSSYATLGSTSITEAKTISVTYAINTYAITFSETGGSGTLKIDGTVRASGYAVTHGSHTFRVEAPDGYIISSITGIDTWSNNDTYATLGSTSITSAKTISVTYASAGTPTLDTIAAVANKNVNNTTFTFPVSVSDRSKASGTLTLQVTSGNTNIITIQNSPYTVSADTTNINATVAGVATGTSTITVKLYDGSTLLDTKTVSIEVTAPTFTLSNKDVYVSSKNSAITKSTSPAPSSISWSSNNTEYITVNSSGQVTAAKVPTSDQTATITATATYASGYTKTVTCTATLHTPNLSATTTAASGTIGTTATGGVTASYPNSDQIDSYSWSSNASTTVAVTNGTTSAPTFTFKKPGSATITLTATYKNTGLTKTATVSITVTQPTCSFTDSSAIALGIGQTQTRSANVSAVGSAATTTLEYSGSNSYITVASDTGAVTGVKPTSSAQTVTATYTITCGGQTTTKTATYNVTVTTPTVNITSADNADFGGTVLLTASSSGATTTPTYSFSASNSKVSIDETTLTAGTSSGTVTITVTATYNASYSKTATQTFTVNAPTIASFAYSTSNMSVGETRGVGNMSTTHPSSISGKWSRNFTSSNTAVATVNPSTGVITAVTPGTFTVTVTILYDGVSTGVSSTTGTLTVATPTVSMDAKTVAKGDSVTFSATTANPSGLTIAYSLKTAVTGVSIDANTGVVTVASTCAASSATVVATAKNSAGTEVATKEATLTIENPELVVKFDGTEVNENDVKYMTAGGSETLDTSDTNFSDTLYYKSSNTSVATIDSSGVISAVAKGTTTITVSTNSSKTLASTRKIKGKGKIATGAVTEQNLTFTVNVAEADTDKFILFTNNYSWSSPQIYYQYKIGSAATQTVGLTAMTKLGTNNSNQSIYGYKMPIEHYNNLTLLIFAGDTSWNTQTVNITSNLSSTTGYYISGDGTGVKARTVGTWNAPAINIPQVTIDDATTALGTNYTMTATPVTSGTVGKYTWSSGTTSVATVTADTGTTASTTVVPVDAGTSTITVNAYAPKPASDFKTWDFASIVSSSDTATMTVTADDRTVTYSQKVSYDGTSYNAPGAGINPGTVTATKTTGGAAVVNGTTVPHNTSVTFEALANSGYKFVGWEVDGVVDSPLSTANKVITVNADKDVKALFQKIYTLTITNSDAEKGTVSKSSVEVIDGVAPDSFTVTPVTGYKIKYADCTNYSTYYSTNGDTTGTVTFTGAVPADAADRIDRTITIAYEVDNKTVTYGTKSKTGADDYSADADAGTVSAVTGYSEGTEGNTPTPSSYKLLYDNTNNNPASLTNNVNVYADTSGSYYTAKLTVPTANSTYYLAFSSSTSYTDVLSKQVNYIAPNNIPLNNNSSAVTTDSYYQHGMYVSGANYNFYMARIRVNAANTDIYVTFNPSAPFDGMTINSSYANYGGNAVAAVPGNPGTPIAASPAQVQAGQTVRFTASANSGYEFVGWQVNGTNDSPLVTTAKEITISADVSVYALFKKQYYITLYNSYIQEADGSFTFVASPPRTVKVGNGDLSDPDNVRATYTYKAGTVDQRGEDNIVTETGNYYEGNKLAVYAGDTIELTYSTLASSEDFKGVFYNNAIRYTTEEETDNLYKLREKYTGDDPKNWGALGDDEWDYDYSASTTLYVNKTFYSGTDLAAIEAAESGYPTVTVDHDAHKISWTAAGDYLNIDLELSSKYKVYINGDDFSGLKLDKYLNTEGYYYNGESFAKQDSGTKYPTIGLDDTVTDCTFSWTGTTATVLKEDETDASGVVVTGKQSNGTNATNLSNLHHFEITGTMPAYDVYITLPVEKTYLMRMSNVVVADDIDSKKMITQTTLKTHINTTTTPASFTGNVGTIAAYVDYDASGETPTYSADISKDSVNHWYYNRDDYNAGSSGIYENNNDQHNYYLAGGVNKTGSNVTAGDTVTYKFTYASGMDAKYSFVGWFEGSYSGGVFTPDYTKKLSGKTTYTYTPTKNTVVFAVATRDIYLGGNFTSTGAYTSTDGEMTWASNRIRMSFDPTWVNGDNKGRYYYDFESVTANTEYKFRCYDTASGSANANITVWNQWSSSNGGFNTDNSDIAYYRDKYEDSQTANSHGGFMYTTAANKKITAARSGGGAEPSATHNISASHQANGYAAPVRVYFYAYDGGMTVNSTYQWSKAYVSAGVGVDVTNSSAVINNSASPVFNSPVVSVANKTVGTAADVDGTSTPVTIGESVYVCTVKEKDGKIRVTACPKDNNLEVEAFVVYNLDTKEATAEKNITATTQTISSTNYNAFYADIKIPQDTKVYVVPVYKFTETYMTTPANNMEEHTVYVRTDGMDKNVWGGMVAMYSWGKHDGLKSGNYPGQLMIPSDDGKSFYGQLQYYHEELAGVTMDNYCYNNFISNYYSKQPDGSAADETNRISSTVYCTNTANVQTYDYREPISIIDNLNDESIKNNYYHVDEMDLTFALKAGNKSANPSNDATSGNSALESASSWEYLTDRSGQNRVDLNGKVIKSNPTATYRVVCQYIKGYKTSAKTYKFNPEAASTMEWAVDWYVYDNENKLLNNGTTSLETSGQSGTLSAAYTDVNKDYMMTEIASILSSQDLPVSGKAVQIAYENPTTFTGNTVRYSGQWYSDPLNSLINANVRIGTYSDGVYSPTSTNALGATTATVDIDLISSPAEGEEVTTETGCTGFSKATVIKSDAAKNKVRLTVSNTTDFEGWFYYDADDEEYKLISKDASITPSFNDDITYYAFYKAAAYYEFHYKGRDNETHIYSVKGNMDLQEEDFAADGTIQKSDTRMADVTSTLGGANQIKVFNRTFTYTIDKSHASNSTKYKLIFTDNGTNNTYTLTPYAYNSSGDLTAQTPVSGNWGTITNLNESLLNNKPSGHSDYVFIGWKEYNPTSHTWGDLVSTAANFGYTLTGNLTVAAYFGTAEDKATALANPEWKSYVDKNEITQELSSPNAGTLYNDNLIRFQFGADTMKMLNQSGYDRSTGLMDVSSMANGAECGFVIIAQENESKDEFGATFTNSGNDKYLNDSRMQSYANYMRTNNKTAAPLTAKSYGKTYAYRVKVESLSRLNRAHIYQALDYEKFTGGNYKVIAYYWDGTSYHYSNAVSGTYTPAA